jgi:hypothetical protein
MKERIMKLTVHQNQLFKAAQTAFFHQTGIKLQMIEEAEGNPLVLIKTPATNVHMEVVANVDTLAVNTLLLLGNRLENRDRTIFIVQQATATQADRFREIETQFIDTAGNCYLNQPQLYLFVKGNKVKLEFKTPTVNRVFKQTGLRVLFALLCNPGLENETYRTIAAKTNVALGMVNWVFKDLNDLGFLLETGTGRTRKLRLLKKKLLLDRWITAYTEQLRPKLVLGKYRGADGWWQNTHLDPGQTLWGGEVAAAKLTDYLMPQEITIYVNKDDPATVIIQNRLKKDPTGDVELVTRFWQPETIAPHGDMVNPILVYADLLASGNQRNIETARIIYDRYIVQLIGND